MEKHRISHDEDIPKLCHHRCENCSYREHCPNVKLSLKDATSILTANDNPLEHLETIAKHVDPVELTEYDNIINTSPLTPTPEQIARLQREARGDDK